jgi:hypothetical protein
MFQRRIEMGCCGSQRQAFSAQPAQRRPLKTAPFYPAATAPVGLEPPPQVATFQYRGSRSLSLRNPATGRRYEFAAPGTRLRAEPADVAWLAACPWLSRVA